MNYKYRMLMLYYLKNQGVHISENSDGCRVNFDSLFDFQYEDLKNIYLAYVDSIPLKFRFDWLCDED